MLVIENKNEFEDYCDNILKHIKSGTYEYFMSKNQYTKVYLKKNSTKFDFTKELSYPYYSEIDINKISATNTSDNRDVIPSNFERVIGSIAHILKNECMPIAVIKQGDDFYIENGKHRFYAHILLRKEVIPVSIREFIDDNIPVDKKMIVISKPLYNNDGMDIIYPEKVLEFYEKYKALFDDIFSVEMVTSDDFKKSFLKFNIRGGDTIEFIGCCTSGNCYRSSSVTCELLNLCGFVVNMAYIKNNPNFILKDKYDAHNINFQRPLMQFKDLFSEIKQKVKKVINYTDYKDEDKHHNFTKTHSYISQYKPFDTPGTHFSSYSSFFVELEDDHYYYIIGSESRGDSKDSIYILRDTSKPFNNITIKFVLKATEGSDEYNDLLKFLRVYNNNPI